MKIGLDGVYAVAGNVAGRKFNRGDSGSEKPGQERVGQERFGHERLVSERYWQENYTLKVIETLATDYPQCTLAVYTPKVSRKTRLNLIDSLHNADYHLPAPSGFQGRLWRLFGITNCLQPDKIDVYHGLNGELPLNIAAAHVPTVVTITEADLQPLRKKGGCPRRHLKLYLLSESLHNATRIIADSESLKDELSKQFGINTEKIEVLNPSLTISTSLMVIYEKAIKNFSHHQIPTSS